MGVIAHKTAVRVVAGLVVGLATTRCLAVAPTPPSPRETTYRSDAVGVTLRVPANMAALSGEQARIGFAWPLPDMRLDLHEPDLRKVGITRASVVVYASIDGYCPPPQPDEGGVPVTLGGRAAYHVTWTDAAGAFGIQGDGFSTLYRGKCFFIAAVIETLRVDYDSLQEQRHADARYKEIAEYLQRVLRTVRFLDRPDSN